VALKNIIGLTVFRKPSEALNIWLKGTILKVNKSENISGDFLIFFNSSSCFTCVTSGATLDTNPVISHE
jgi:hypothetical protein